jgi:cysteine desulfurase
VVLNGHPTERLPNTINVSFVGRPADVIALWGLSPLHRFGVSRRLDRASPVLSRAMGIEPPVGMGARLSLGRMTTAAAVDAALVGSRRCPQPHSA